MLRSRIVAGIPVIASHAAHLRPQRCGHSSIRIHRHRDRERSEQTHGDGLRAGRTLVRLRAGRHPARHQERRASIHAVRITDRQRGRRAGLAWGHLRSEFHHEQIRVRRITRQRRPPSTTASADSLRRATLHSRAARPSFSTSKRSAPAITTAAPSISGPMANFTSQWGRTPSGQMRRF